MYTATMAAVVKPIRSLIEKILVHMAGRLVFLALEIIWFEKYITSRYKENVERLGSADQLATIDIVSALDLFYSQEQYSKCFEMAKPHSDQLLHKYVALYAAQLVKDKKYFEAVDLYHKYGTPAYNQNFNLYRKLTTDIFGLDDSEISDQEKYFQWARLRSVLHNLTENLQRDKNNEMLEEFEKFLLICHYYGVKWACRNVASLEHISLKISIALLRYSDIIPADKAYYEAGIDARNFGRESEAFVFLNHYLDLHEAIEENNVELVDYSDLRITDFPTEVPLPEKTFLDEKRNEAVKEWVLTVSMNRNLDQSLPIDDRGLYFASLKSSQKGLDAASYPPCIITGWPAFGAANTVLKNTAVEFKKGKHHAIKDDWMKILMESKNISSSSPLSDVVNFIYEWCGSTPSFTFQ